MRRRLAPLALSAVTLASAVGFLAAPANASLGGGCGYAPGGVQACISGSGSVAKGDAYVNTAYCSGGRTIRLVVHDLTTGAAPGYNYLCTRYVGPKTLPLQFGHKYRTEAYIPGRPEAHSWSPELTG